jgi:ribonuclease HII
MSPDHRSHSPAQAASALALALPACPRPAAPGLALEHRLLSRGYGLIAGIDEAGRGAWAGPVVAAAVILPLDRADLLTVLKGVNDSKKLTARQREQAGPQIEALAVAAGVGMTSAADIDRLGIVPATRLAMQRAVAKLAPPPQALLIDAVDLTALVPLPQHALFYGDAISLSIAAASILAKLSRDHLMTALDAQYPDYGFARHKGYGTAVHQAALARLGASEIHRRSFAPVKARCTKEYNT